VFGAARHKKRLWSTLLSERLAPLSLPAYDRLGLVTDEVYCYGYVFAPLQYSHSFATLSRHGGHMEFQRGIGVKE